MKFFQFLTFTLLSLSAIATIIVAMSTKHWTATRSGPDNVFGQNQQAYGGLRRWYTDNNGDSQSWNRNQYAPNRFWVAGSWALGWGITAVILILLSHIVISMVKARRHGRGAIQGMTGKMISATLMFLAAACILVGSLTYWSHLPQGYDSLSWSFGIYVMGGALALLTSILLCAMPVKHFHHNEAKQTVVTQQMATTGSFAPASQPAYINQAPSAIVVQ